MNFSSSLWFTSSHQMKIVHRNSAGFSSTQKLQLFVIQEYNYTDTIKVIEFSLDTLFWKVFQTLGKCSLYFKCIFNIGTVVVNCSCTKLLQCAPDMKVWGSENRGKTFKVSKVPKQKV